MIWLIATVTALLGFLLGCHPTVAEGVRKRHVRDMPQVFPNQYEELEDDG